MWGVKERGLGKWALMEAGLAEAAGLIARSDGAVDDLMECEMAWVLAPSSSSSRHPTTRVLLGPGNPPPHSSPSWGKPWTLAGRYLMHPGSACICFAGDGGPGTPKANSSED